MIPRSHCRTSIFGEYKGRWRCPYSYCHTKHYFDIFVEVALCLAMSIWKSPLAFGPEILFELLACMHWESIGSFKDERCTIGYVPQLNWNGRAYDSASSFSGFDLYVKLELFRSSYFGSKSYSVPLIWTHRKSYKG